MLKNEIKKDETEKIYLELEKEGETLFTREVDGLICELHIYLEKHGEKDQAIRLLTCLINDALESTTNKKKFCESLGLNYSGLRLSFGYSHPNWPIELRGQIFSKKEK